jgi:dienelactone hydrolase
MLLVLPPRTETADEPKIDTGGPGRNGRNKHGINEYSRVMWRWLVLVALAGCGSKNAENPAPAADAAVPVTPSLKVVSRAPLTGTETATNKAFFGDIVIVRINGVTPHASVRLHAETMLRGTWWSSDTTFEANDKGEVDTSRDAPTSGYEGVDPDGPLWSMTQRMEPNKAAERAIVFEAFVDEASVATATLDRYLAPDGVTRLPVTDDGLVGAYYAQKDGKKHPTILSFGGSEGGLGGGEGAAMYWAGLGYTTLAVAYFADTGLPATLTNVPLEYFEKAMKWLDGRPEADATKLAVMGGSRGGELALLLGATFPRIKAIVARVPSGVVWGSTGTPTDPAWTYMGTPFVSLPGSDTAMPTRFKDTDGKLLWESTPTFNAALDEATPEELEAARIKVEKTAGAVFMISGADDKLWPSCRLASIAWERLKRPNDRNECYPGAGHYVPAPGNPTTQAHRTYHPGYKLWFALGGNAKDAAHASRDADKKLRTFLAETLK